MALAVTSPPINGALWSMRNIVLSIALCWLLTCNGFCESYLEQTNLFVAGQDGYHTYRIPALMTCSNGTLLAFCEGRAHSSADTGKIDLIFKRSTDLGRSWSPAEIIFADGPNVCGNPTAVLDSQNGMVWLFLTWNLGSDSERDIIAGKSINTRRVYITHTRDNGQIWARPRDITDAVKEPSWGWYATGPGNGIQLFRSKSRGRLIIPANHTERTGTNSFVSRAHVLYSDDHGTSWKIGGIEEEQTNESAVAELADGSVIHNMRSYHGRNRRAIAHSSDAGLTWSKVTLDQALIEPVCQAALLRYSWPAEGLRSILLFCNPASTRREAMTVRLSYDEGVSWPVKRLLNSKPAAYSALATLPNGDIGCLYECGDKTPYEKITFARFNLNWLVHDPDKP